MDHLFSVKDQVVLVSGASRGIGEAIAAGFVERGARVVITGRYQDTIEKTAESLSTDTNPVLPLVCDVSDTGIIGDCVQRVVTEYGRIDTLINVAGVNLRMDATAYVPEDYDFIMDINLKGAFFMAQAVGKCMIDQKAGSQIHIDSFASHGPLKCVVPYAMSKSGITALTKGLALEWGNHGIRVNGIAPGFIVTDLNRKLWENKVINDWGLQHTPLARLGSADDIVGTALFLASEASAFITGQTLRVDGGTSAGYAWPIDQL